MPEPAARLLHAIGNAHIDPVWLWRWPEGLETIRATFASALDRMEEFPEFRFTGSSAVFYKMLAETDPDLFARVRERVREGRWEIVGGWWIQPDANIPSGEALVRQGLYGQRFFERELGVRATVGYNPDTFGHAGTLPQILRGVGLTRYVFMRPGPHEMELPANVFRWRSADGAEVVVARITDAYCTWPEQLEEHVRRNAAARPAEVSDYIVFYGVGNHGGGPTVANIRSLVDMAGRDGLPATELSTLDRFFTSVEGEIRAGAPAPVVASELQHHARGCYSVHSEVKRENRRCEHLLLAAERAASVAAMAVGRPYPAQALDEAWEGVLFNQFHDILAGTSLPEAYADARDLYGHAATIASTVLNQSLQAVTGRIDTRGEGDALVVWNLLPWQVRAPVEVERGPAGLRDDHGEPVAVQLVQPTTVAGQRRCCFVADLPALGYRVYRSAEPAEVASQVGLTADTTAIENDWWRVEATGDGRLARLYDKRAGREVLTDAGADLIVLDDPSDTWSHDVVSFRSEAGRFAGGRAALEESGPVRASLRLESGWGESRATMWVRLYRDVDDIDCVVEIDWREHGKAVKLAFPTPLRHATATAEAAYGHAGRVCSGEEEPMQQWVDISGDGPYGLAVLNDSKYSYDALEGDLRITLLRSPVYAHHDPAKLSGDAHYAWMDQGVQTVRLQIVPHAGAWQQARLPRRAWALNVPPVSVNEYNHSGPLSARASYLDADAPNVLLTVLKQAEDAGAWVVRGYETDGSPAQGRVRLPSLGVELNAAFGPHAIQSWRVGGGGAVPVSLLEESAD